MFGMLGSIMSLRVSGSTISTRSPITRFAP
jgi:hypothetical protein